MFLAFTTTHPIHHRVIVYKIQYATLSQFWLNIYDTGLCWRGDATKTTTTRTTIMMTGPSSSRHELLFVDGLTKRLKNGRFYWPPIRQLQTMTAIFMIPLPRKLLHIVNFQPFPCIDNYPIISNPKRSLKTCNWSGPKGNWLKNIENNVIPLFGSILVCSLLRHRVPRW